MWGFYICGRSCAGGRLGNGAADTVGGVVADLGVELQTVGGVVADLGVEPQTVGGGSSVCDEVEDEVQQ